MESPPGFGGRGVMGTVGRLLEWWCPGRVERKLPEVRKAGGGYSSSPGRRQWRAELGWWPWEYRERHTDARDAGKEEMTDFGG